MSHQFEKCLAQSLVVVVIAAVFVCTVTTRLVTPDVVWTLGRAADSPFVIKADIAYPVDETYRYPFYTMRGSKVAGWVTSSACIKL